MIPFYQRQKTRCEKRGGTFKDVSLVKFFSETDGQDDLHKHLLITGEGGMGKTVSLLKTCDYLLSKRINAIWSKNVISCYCFLFKEERTLFYGICLFSLDVLLFRSSF